jgi:hypothetical protein
MIQYRFWFSPVCIPPGFLESMITVMRDDCHCCLFAFLPVLRMPQTAIISTVRIVDPMDWIGRNRLGFPLLT